MNRVTWEGCDGNQDNAINSEDIQTSVVADTREVYQEDEICNGTKRRITVLTDKGKEYQLKIIFEKRKRVHARMTRKCTMIDDSMYSSSNVITVKEETDQFSDQFKSWCTCTKSMLVCCQKKWLMKTIGLKQLMKLCLPRNTKCTIGSKLKETLWSPFMDRVQLPQG